MSDLATRQNHALANATSPRFGGLQGEDSNDVIMPRAHIFQGLPLEKEKYGKHDEGDLINTITGELLGESTSLPKFVPIFGFKEWTKTEKVGGQRRLVYRTKNREDVPPDDLNWISKADGTREKPAAMESINYVCLFEGLDTPLVFRFQSTSLSAGKTLNTLEKFRKNGPGLYAIELKKKTNDQGSWLTPSIRPAGNPSPEMMDMARALFESFSGQNVVVNDGDDENLPI